MSVSRAAIGVFVAILLVGCLVSVMIIGGFFDGHSKSFHQENDCQELIVPQHYQLEFHDQFDRISCQMKITFHLMTECQQFSIFKSTDQTIDQESLALYQQESRIAIRSRIDTDRIIVRKHPWKHRFHPGNYSISINSRMNVSNRVGTGFVRQIWADDHRVLFTNRHFFPYIPAPHHRSTFNVNVISADQIIANLPLGQISSPFGLSSIGFALLRNYECRSMKTVELCLPTYSHPSIDLFSHLLNLTVNIMPIFDGYFSRAYPRTRLTLIAVLQLNQPFLSLPGLAFLDQNRLLTNTSTTEALEQQRLIFDLLAQQWIDSFDGDQRWIGLSLARSIGNHLFQQHKDPLNSQQWQWERVMSTVIIDSLCNTTLEQQSINEQSDRDAIVKGEVFLTEYRLFVGDATFRTRVQQLLQSSNASAYLSILCPDLDPSALITWSTSSGHPIVFLNASTFEMRLFKFDPNCSTSIPPFHPINYRLLGDSSIYQFTAGLNHSSLIIPSSPLIHLVYPSWDRLLDEMRFTRSSSSYPWKRLLFDSFLFNFANQISVTYPLELLKVTLQQSLSMSSPTDWIVLQKIMQWYRSMLADALAEKFLLFLRRFLNPVCANQLSSAYAVNDVLFEICCSINHSICLQHVSNRLDPSLFLQSILHHHSLDFISTDQNQSDLLTSFNQLQMPSAFLYPNRMVRSMVCQLVRQQNAQYWYDFVHLLEQKFVKRRLPALLIDGLSCGIRTREQVDYYLQHLCPSTPSKWPCYRHVVEQASIRLTLDTLHSIDNEDWSSAADELIDFCFRLGHVEGNFTRKAMIIEFRSLLSGWYTRNEVELLHWLDNEHRRNAYLI